MEGEALETVGVQIETIDKIGSIEINISEDNEDLLKYLIMSWIKSEPNEDSNSSAVHLSLYVKSNGNSNDGNGGDIDNDVTGSDVAAGVDSGYGGDSGDSSDSGDVGNCGLQCHLCSACTWFGPKLV